MIQTYLIFGHRGARYGLDVRTVREMVWLPELSPIEELPAHVIGVFNLRGRVVPVIDLGLRFGHARSPLLVSDRVIVIDSGEGSVGLVVGELHAVVAVPQAAIEDVRSYQGAGGNAQFVRGEARLEDGLVMLLDADALLRDAPFGEALAPSPPAGATDAPSPGVAGLAQETVDTLRGRAQVLAREVEAAADCATEAYAVIGLDGERFGLGLDLVREFAHLRGVSPLPCCPPHILGNMNLRGDILTLVDIRRALGMPASGTTNEVVVVRAGELQLGLPVTEIVAVVNLAPSDIAAVPVASNRAGKAYCEGVATVGGHAVGILDLAKILAARELRVAEEIQ